MSCFDSAGAVWGPGFVWQPNDNSPATVYTEPYLDAYPAQLLAQGYTCEQAKAELLATFEFIGQSGSLGVVRNGTVVPGYADGMVIPMDGFEGWRVNTFTNGALEIETTFPPITDPWSSQIAGVDFTLRQFFRANFSQSTVLKFQIPVTQILTSFDFEAWWLCASGCGAAPRPTPRLGMQTLSNFTYSVINSFGQVPKI